MKKYQTDNNFVKLCFLTFILTHSIFSLRCVSKNSIANNSDSSSNNEVQQNINTYNSYSNERGKIDVPKYINSVETSIKKTSKDFGLQNLKDIKLSDNEVEIRIWAELRYEIVNCLVLHKSAEKWGASVVSARVADYGTYEKNKEGKIIVDNRKLSNPRSGWESVNSYLEQKNIHVPLPYAWDTQTNQFFNDEGKVALEVKEGKNYSLVSYREFTDTSDGKTVINVCNYLENEFDVRIGCGY